MHALFVISVSVPMALTLQRKQRQVNESKGEILYNVEDLLTWRGSPSYVNFFFFSLSLFLCVCLRNKYTNNMDFHSLTLTHKIKYDRMWQTVRGHTSKSQNILHLHWFTLIYTAFTMSKNTLTYELWKLGIVPAAFWRITILLPELQTASQYKNVSYKQ